MSDDWWLGEEKYRKPNLHFKMLSYNALTINIIITWMDNIVDNSGNLEILKTSNAVKFKPHDNITILLTLYLFLIYYNLFFHVFRYINKLFYWFY